MRFFHVTEVKQTITIFEMTNILYYYTAKKNPLMWLVNEPGIAIDIPCEKFDIHCEQAIPRWEPHAKINDRRIASTLYSGFYASRLLK